MLKSLAAVLATALVLGGGASWAATSDLEFYTGEDLYGQCSAKPTDADFQPRQARCSGYVMGVSDAAQAAQSKNSTARGDVCLPPTTSSAQIVDAVIHFMDANSDKRRFAAQDLVFEALTSTFPCT